MELSVEEDEPLEDITQDDGDGVEDSDVRSAAEAAFFTGLRAKQKTVDIK